MGYYDDVVANYNKDNFDLLEFLQLRSPNTPQEQGMISMGDFHVDILRDCVIYNVFQQGLTLKPKTTQKLIEFLRGDFTDITKKTSLQVLIHYTKMDVDLQYRKYLAYCDAAKLPEAQRVTVANFFDKKILSFVTHANMDCGIEGAVWTFPEYIKKRIQDALCSEAMTAAFEEAMKMLVTHKSTPIPDLHKQITEMKIYGVKKFAPLSTLRGACLVDGILLCTNNLAGYEGTAINQADIITISMHECANFLGRLIFKDFNFSSPSKYLTDECEKRVDQVLPDTSLEMGRNMELLLLEGVQPSWATSTEEAAVTFYSRLRTYTSYPIIRAIERETLGVETRLSPSPPFGIDIEDTEFFC